MHFQNEFSPFCQCLIAAWSKARIREFTICVNEICSLGSNPAGGGNIFSNRNYYFGNIPRKYIKNVLFLRNIIMKNILDFSIGKIAIDWGVYGIPETFIIDSNGIIKYRHVGPVTQKVYEKMNIIIEEIN